MQVWQLATVQVWQQCRSPLPRGQRTGGGLALRHRAAGVGICYKISFNRAVVYYKISDKGSLHRCRSQAALQPALPGSLISTSISVLFCRCQTASQPVAPCTKFRTSSCSCVARAASPSRGAGSQRQPSVLSLQGSAKACQWQCQSPQPAIGSAKRWLVLRRGSCRARWP